MANVYTKKSLFPRTTTLGHFCKPLRLSERQAMVLSPTRLQNPHPHGLIFQSIRDKTNFPIWNPEQPKKMPYKLNHLKWVNFTCGPVELKTRKIGEVPDIKYTVSTVSRVSYQNPTLCYPSLKNQCTTSRFGYRPQKGAAIGIVPDSRPRRYTPVEPPEHPQQQHDNTPVLPPIDKTGPCFTPSKSTSPKQRHHSGRRSRCKGSGSKGNL